MRRSSYDSEYERVRREAGFNRPEFPETEIGPPPPIEEYDLSGRLAQVFVPDGHHRYAGFVAWSKTAEIKWWKFGKSSDGRSGIWIPWGIWELGTQQTSAEAQQARDRAKRIIEDGHRRNAELDQASQE
jgi:hypothetical protein